MVWGEIGIRIKNLRREKNMTQTNFGELIGISRQYVGKIESGQPLTVEQIAIICEKTGTTMDYLVFGIIDPLANMDFLNDLTAEQINISLDILKRVAELVKMKNGNSLLIRELMRRQIPPLCVSK